MNPDGKKWTQIEKMNPDGKERICQLPRAKREPEKEKLVYAFPSSERRLVRIIASIEAKQEETGQWITSSEGRVREEAIGQTNVSSEARALQDETGS